MSSPRHRPMRRCRAMYEPDSDPQRTHTCARLAPHDPPHLCPVCQCTWTYPGGPTRHIGKAAGVSSEEQR